MSNKMIIPETREQEQILKEFTLFIALFNSMNGTRYNVDYALEDERITDAFTNFKRASGNIVKNQKIQLKSTSRRSLGQINVDSLDYKVYNLLKSYPGTTRKELQIALDMK